MALSKIGHDPRLFEDRSHPDGSPASGLVRIGPNLEDWTHPVIHGPIAPHPVIHGPIAPHPVIHGPIALPPDAAQRKRLLEDTSEKRKRYPIARGLLDYFPDACAAVAEVSFAGNEKHNPGEEIHWARGKSMDHADCIGRHLIERGGFDGPIRHSAALAWRALALLQEELEAEYGLATPRGAKDGPTGTV